MTPVEAPKLTNPQIVETLVFQLAEPPTEDRNGIEDFYKRIDPKHELSAAIRIDPDHKRPEATQLTDDRVERVYWSDQNSMLHLEATVRLSWQDLQNYKNEKFEPATVLGTLLDFGCATMDEKTGLITTTETVPEQQENRKSKQNIVDYIFAHKDSDGSWIVGGIKRRKTSNMVFQISGAK